jgi:hypothetical protein
MVGTRFAELYRAEVLHVDSDESQPTSVYSLRSNRTASV